MQSKLVKKLFSPEDSTIFITEGSVVERLKRDGVAGFDQDILHAGLVITPHGRAALSKLYNEYLAIAQKHNIPIIISTSTWKASPANLGAAGYHEDDFINKRSVELLIDLRKSYDDFADNVIISGLMGPKGDAYNPVESLADDEAADYHAFQVEKLSKSGADFLLGSTIPALSEALGMAKAMAASSIPYVISFVTGNDGRLLDGTMLETAIDIIDNNTKVPPGFYMINCVHPDNFQKALMAQGTGLSRILKRLRGLQGNTSKKSPKELEGSPQLETEDAGIFAAAMIEQQKEFGLKVLGGCCGTDGNHIRALADLLISL